MKNKKVKIVLWILKLFRINKIGHSYHDVIVYVDGKPYKISHLPYGYELAMNRVGGWSLWYRSNERQPHQTVGAEYNLVPFRIEVNGIIICDYKPEK